MIVDGFQCIEYMNFAPPLPMHTTITLQPTPPKQSSAHPWIAVKLKQKQLKPLKGSGPGTAEALHRPSGSFNVWYLFLKPWLGTFIHAFATPLRIRILSRSSHQVFLKSKKPTCHHPSPKSSQLSSFYSSGIPPPSMSSSHLSSSSASSAWFSISNSSKWLEASCLSLHLAQVIPLLIMFLQVVADLTIKPHEALVAMSTSYLSCHRRRQR